ncbi:MAG TPA: pirin family protein [Candidatus Kapabacteria bacterium]|nr:pirin family protein [Candidatus Kapabacteria bacterium]
MINLVKSNERGHTKLDWLNSYHSFSFGDYFDPKHHNFGPLRVLNDDTVEPGTGFGAHPHHDMEIVTYVLEGELEHQDSTGGRGVIAANEVQRMTAGKGIVHSEYNHSDLDRVHFLQIWFMPNKQGLTPGYEQKQFTKEHRKNILLPVASPSAEGGSVRINQDVAMFISHLEPSKQLAHSLASGRGGYLFVVRGGLNVNGTALSGGDAVAISDEKEIAVTATNETELVFFDVPLEGWH